MNILGLLFGKEHILGLLFEKEKGDFSQNSFGAVCRQICGSLDIMHINAQFPENAQSFDKMKLQR